jgi:hypothetical protein
MTLGDIWTAVSIEIGVRADVAGEKQTLATRLANSAVLEILKRTKVRVTSATMATTANVGDYDLSTPVLRTTQLLAPAADGQFGPLEHVSPEEIDWRRRAASATNSDPALAYALDGFNLLKLYPVPLQAYNLVIYYVPRPTKMTDPAHDPSTIAYGGIPEEYHEEVLLPYVFWKFGSQGDDQSSAQGKRYDQDFEEGVKELRRRINRRKGRLGPARTAYTRRRVSARNDTA